MTQAHAEPADMTATEVSGEAALPGRPRPQSARGRAVRCRLGGGRCRRGAASVRAAYPPAARAPPRGGLAAGPVPQGRLTVAVVLGASGSVITDALGPFEVFARSPDSSYTRCPPPAAMLSGGLAVVPDIRAARWTRARRPVPTWWWSRPWLPPAAKNGRCASWRPAGPPGAQLLGVRGSRLLRRGPARRPPGHLHWSRLKGLQRSRPQVDWVRGQRYVQDGKITTTAGVTSGVFGALRLVQQLAGAAEAQRVGRSWPTRAGRWMAPPASRAAAGAA